MSLDFGRLFCACHEAPNAPGMYIPECNTPERVIMEEFAVVHMLRSQEMLLSLLKWRHMKTFKVSGLSSI